MKSGYIRSKRILNLNLACSESDMLNPYNNVSLIQLVFSSVTTVPVIFLFIKCQLCHFHKNPVT